MAIGVTQYPGALDTVKTLVEVANDAVTTLTAPLGIGDTVAQVANTSRFSNSGFAVFESEIASFDGKTPTTLTNLVRGQQGTVAAGHASGVDVEQMVTARDHNVLAEAIIALQTKAGIGDRTFVHDQIAASATWVVAHNLNCNPAVSVVDSAGDIVYGNVRYDSLNQITVTFSAPFSGKAYLN